MPGQKAGLLPNDKVTIFALIAAALAAGLPVIALTRSLILVFALGGALYLCYHLAWRRWKKWLFGTLAVGLYIGVVLLLFELEARSNKTVAPTTSALKAVLALVWGAPWPWIFVTAAISVALVLLTQRHRRMKRAAAKSQTVVHLTAPGVDVHAECKKRIAMLSEDARTHSIRADARDGEIAQLKVKYAAAMEMADYQAAKISDFVDVIRVCVYDADLDNALPTLTWGIALKNRSMFRISLDGEVGSRFFEDQRLTAEKEIADNEIRGLWPDREGQIVFRQRLTDTEAAFIKRTPKGRFHFDKVRLSVKGGPGADHVQSRRVIIFPEFRTELDKCSDLQSQASEPLRKEVEDLKSQLKAADNVLDHDQKAERKALIASWRASIAKAYRDYQDSGWSFTGLLATQDDYLSLSPNLSPEAKTAIEDAPHPEYHDVRRLVNILAEDIARIEREWGL